MSAAKNPTLTAVGRRKTASARVHLKRGTGEITINGRPASVLLYTEALIKAATSPLRVAGLEGQVDVLIRVSGGGPNGQAGAISHALARALQKLDLGLRPSLKKAGLLTRDGRMRERKKPGRPGARKRFQFSKR
ncbi:MAG TPA: 30S ribosomal protein S9 [Opitutae bacterium]|nr:30S ribosomal protein S9 [Opitutae bacterium]